MAQFLKHFWVLLLNEKSVSCCVPHMFARSGGGDVNEGNARRSLVCYPDSRDWVPEKCRELCRYAVSRGGRHGILLWHRSSWGIALHRGF